ncbi:hypothetical protein E2562_001145 [Oryza meyeriana var. granulata]|uniref:Uncharacterized protein n=1 Tax=Oryza meyeriana var. granulata TaxID=110450 RepID=A0A6G1EDU4_9ORYZ|nr:hypothetical protein E2562_001145 [Oryza meyeriana var. granulata]
MKRQPTGEADEGEEVTAIVEEVDWEDRHAREDKENLDAGDDEDADDDTPEPAWWNCELTGYIVKNELHNSVWFYGEGPINLGAIFATKSALQDAVKSWSLKL